MKRLADQTLYEVLEVRDDAAMPEIEKAYQRARDIYGPGSLATYSLMDPDEAELLAKRIEEAKATLLDPAARARYDETIRQPKQAVATASVATAGVATAGGGPFTSLPPVIPAATPPPVLPAVIPPLAAPERPQFQLAFPPLPLAGEGTAAEEAPSDEAPAEASPADAAAPEARGAGDEAEDGAAEQDPASLDLDEPSGSTAAALDELPGDAAAALDELPGDAAASPDEVSGDTAAALDEPSGDAAPLALDAPAGAELAAAAQAAPPEATPAEPPPAEPVPEEPAPEEPPRAEASPVEAVPLPPPPPPRAPILLSREVRAPPTPYEGERFVSAAERASEEVAAAARSERPSPTPPPLPAAPAAAPPPPVPIPVVPDGAWTGDALRQMREARGLTLQQIAERTKVTRHHLENIEAERFASLPAPVYLRGILLTLARELRLDGQKVARAFLDRAAAALGKK